MIGAISFGVAGCAVRPVPLTPEERVVEAKDDMRKAFADQQPLTRPLTMEEAFARALAYILDQRAKLMEVAVARTDVDLANIEMLPKVVVDAGYVHRNNQEASSSVSVLTNQQSLEPSTSSDRLRRSADLALSWNILDFGVSYFSARQQADRTLIVREQRRRVIQNLFQDIRRAFWRAAGAQALAHEVRATISSAEAALATGRKLESEGLRSPIDALRYQKAMLDLLRQLEAVERQLALSKSELAALINLPPGQRFTLAIPRRMPIERLKVPVTRMEEIALLHNPDILELSYQTRISADETRKAFVRMLPGVTLSYGRYYDSNSFFVNNHWGLDAARMSWSALGNLLAAPYQIRRARNLQELADLKRQAMSVVVLAKLHISYQQYISAAREYRWSAQLADVDRRLYRQIANRTATDAQSELERVSAQVSTVFSDVRRYLAYAEMQAALGRLYATIGVDPMPENVEVLDLASLSKIIVTAAEEADKDNLLAPTAAELPAGDIAPPDDKRRAALAPAEPVKLANTVPPPVVEAPKVAEQRTSLAQTPVPH